MALPSSLMALPCEKEHSVWFIEELFLNGCVPAVRKELRKRILKLCYGCGSDQNYLGQGSHDCLKEFEHVVTVLLPECVMFLDSKRYKIIRRMRELLETDQDGDYGPINGLQILEFLGSEYEDPFKMLALNKIWQARLQTKLIEDAHMIFPMRNPTVAKRPSITDMLSDNIFSDNTDDDVFA